MRYRALFGAKNKGDAEWEESVCSEGDYILLLLHGQQQSLFVMFNVYVCAYVFVQGFCLTGNPLCKS